MLGPAPAYKRVVRLLTAKVNGAGYGEVNAPYNLREFELTRHVSLRQLDPVALLNLKTTGSCTVSIPEWLYDLDGPGHYMRRIKTVAVSIPSVVGPYTSVNCTLSLQHSSIRISPEPGSTYARDTAHDDARFADYSGSMRSVVTSSALSDSGTFETNMRDERFLPFEGAGAVSTWSLSLPEIRAFDYGTITDVIFHLCYTARDGGEPLATAALHSLRQLPPPAAHPCDPTPLLALLVSLRHDFPTEWYAFVKGANDFSATVPRSFFPDAVRDATLTISSITLYAADDGTLEHTTVPAPATMGSELLSNGSTELYLPADDTVLSRDETREVYAIIAYTACLL
jgi:hypothetical protein